MSNFDAGILVGYQRAVEDMIELVHTVCPEKERQLKEDMASQVDDLRRMIRATK